jgi:hypothetical protein
VNDISERFWRLDVLAQAWRNIRISDILEHNYA